jgi:hypothetical protein
MKNVTHLCVAGILCLVAGGCAQGPKLPDYQPPKLAASQIVTVNAGFGTYVTVIDNTSGPGSALQMSDWGGILVLLTPGKHHLTLSTNHSSRMFSDQQIKAIDFDFIAGHHYAIGPTNMFNTRLTITDQETSQKVPL